MRICDDPFDWYNRNNPVAYFPQVSAHANTNVRNHLRQPGAADAGAENLPNRQGLFHRDARVSAERAKQLSHFRPEN